MKSIGERCRYVGRVHARQAVDGGLENIAMAPAEAVGQAIIGAPTPEREAHHRVGRDTVIEAGGKAITARRAVMASKHCIAGRVVLAAIGRGPDTPAPWVGDPRGALVERSLVD